MLRSAAKKKRRVPANKEGWEAHSAEGWELGQSHKGKKAQYVKAIRATLSYKLQAGSSGT